MLGQFGEPVRMVKSVSKRSQMMNSDESTYHDGISMRDVDDDW